MTDWSGLFGQGEATGWQGCLQQQMAKRINKNDSVSELADR